MRRPSQAFNIGAALFFGACTVGLLYRAWALEHDLQGWEALRLFLSPAWLFGEQAEFAPGFPLPDVEAVHRYRVAALVCAALTCLWLTRLPRPRLSRRRLLRRLVRKLGRRRRWSGHQPTAAARTH